VLKRSFDVIAAASGLLVLTPVLVVVALLVKLDSRGPILFRQERVGRQFRPFWIYKFRTMVEESSAGPSITCGADRRITRAGRLLRALKLDELPQLVNVLKGDMSLVGPRPEVPRYVAMYREDYTDILRVRPGITDLASLAYHNESELLGRFEDPEEAYARQILPDKVRLARSYLAQANFVYDLRLIMTTLAAIATRGHWPRHARPCAAVEKPSGAN
jgi:lipopolysaccharide/colanic/teichoic acid biosynthesis glycosyltransferase